MIILRNPYIRVSLAIAFVIMLYFMPTREFLKTTFILGIPFVFVLGYMVKQPRASLRWAAGALGLLLVAGLYGYELVQLPERIHTRVIVRDGAALMSAGRYDEAISTYQQLAELGQTETMGEKIAAAEGEKDAQLQLDQARELISQGNLEEARRIIEALPTKTKAAWEGRDLLQSLK